MEKKEILIVDDCEVNQYILKHIVKEQFAGTVDTIIREDGTQALQYIEEVRGQLAMVLSDINMPNMNGIELAIKIKEQYPNLPLMILSANIADYTEQLAEIGLDTDHQFKKPVLGNALFSEQLKKIIEK